MNNKSPIILEAAECNIEDADIILQNIIIRIISAHNDHDSSVKILYPKRFSAIIKKMNKTRLLHRITMKKTLKTIINIYKYIYFLSHK